VKDSTEDLAKIIDGLHPATTGGTYRNEVKTLETLAAKLQANIDSEIKQAAKIGDQEGRQAFLKEMLPLWRTAMTNVDVAKANIQQRIDAMTAETKVYEANVMSHRDTHTEERGSFWFFSWKVRDIHNDNGERIATAQQNQHLVRIEELKREKGALNTTDLEAKINNGTKEEASIAKSLEPERKERERILEEQKAILKEVAAVQGRMNAIEASCGTSNQATMDEVTKLTTGIQRAQLAFVKMANRVKADVKMLKSDPRQLNMLFVGTMELLCVCDEYSGTHHFVQFSDFAQNELAAPQIE